ncbi:nervous system development [Seminavis robusta]|uniref:Nervous system development n=1 Tax=Seminavis robusta TaxID=568900 RepID=A0A9N8EYY2_9STRA|nr:nervous system development [Seminavis robusta]|eukprot:Sro2572_g331640.1 nervous system development (471) ;mRNA; f:8917-10329
MEHEADESQKSLHAPSSTLHAPRWRSSLVSLIRDMTVTLLQLPPDHCKISIANETNETASSIGRTTMASTEEETRAVSLIAKRFKISEEGPPPPNDNNQGLTWRGDPNQTYSDWKIIVDEPTQAATYHVHKGILTCGSTKSEYFTRLFQNTSNFWEGKSCTTQLELDPVVATAFPTLLDYLYDEYKSLQIDTKTATALYYLGEYLDIHSLRWDALQFCKKNVSLDKVDIYYEHAMIFQNENILCILAKFLGQNILHISPEAEILRISSPDLWVNALEQSPKTPETSRHISKLMARFVQHNPDALDLETFQALTCLEITPQIEWDAALTLCALEAKAGIHSTEQLSKLQERCSDSLAQNWESLVLTDDTTTKLLQDRKAAFLVDLLLKSLKDANSKLTKCQASLSSTQDELKKFRPFSSKSGGWRDPRAVPDSLCNVNPSLRGKSTYQYCPYGRSFPHCIFLYDEFEDEEY